MPPFSEDDCDGSVAQALLALSSKARNHAMETKHNRNVRYAPKHNIEWVEAVPLQCRSFYWLSKKEFEEIKEECADTVAKSKLDNTIHTRGLEKSTMSGEDFLQCYLHRRGALRAVLNEQAIQKKTGYSDPDAIANAYTAFSRKSIEMANVRAEMDELAVRL
jgi:hypothetical protein